MSIYIPPKINVGSQPSGSQTSAAVVTSATTTFVTALTTTVTITQTSVIIARATADWRATTAACIGQGRITINGVAGQLQSVSLLNTTDHYTSAVEAISTSLNPGIYTINYQINRLSGTGTVNFFQGSLIAQGLQGASTNGLTTLTGDVTAGPGNGSQVSTIAALAVTNAKIANVTITGAKIANSTITNALISTVDTSKITTGTLPYARGGTGATAFATQRIPFSNGTNFVADANFIYDTTNNRFYIGAGGGNGRVNGTVASGGTDLAGNFYTRGSNNCIQGQNENAWSISLINAGLTAVGAAVNFEASRGTLVARTQSQSGDVLGTINAQGYTGSAWNGYAGGIQFVATENVTSTTQGGDIVLLTTPNGSTTALERFRITQSGHLKSIQVSAPTTTTNTNAGTGASSNVANATDVSGSLTLITGTTSTSAGVQCTVNFDKAYTVAPIVSITPSSANSILKAVIQGIYITSTTTGFSVNFVNAETLSTTYNWYYQIMETQ